MRVLLALQMVLWRVQLGCGAVEVRRVLCGVVRWQAQRWAVVGRGVSALTCGGRPAAQSRARGQGRPGG